MDAYLTGEAEKDLQALLTIGSPAGGYLIGHRRGRRFYIENMFVLPTGSFLPVDQTEKLDILFERRIIGVFLQNPDEKKRAQVPCPYFTGRLYLEIRREEGRPDSLHPYLIDFDGSFGLTAITMGSSPKEE